LIWVYLGWLLTAYKLLWPHNDHFLQVIIKLLVLHVFYLVVELRCLLFAGKEVPNGYIVFARNLESLSMFGQVLLLIALNQLFKVVHLSDALSSKVVL
jgi:hypothetical protein